MVTRIRKNAKLHLYIEEWMENRGLNDGGLGSRMGVSATTVWRWRNEQHRLDPPKIAAIANALDLEDPRDLFRPPTRPGIPLDELGDDDYRTVRDLANRLARKAS
jgi:transcriptional regulator with XRE-family HTH domain